ncbi:MAG: major capsid protein [Gammaproteobacteria bacterium]|nr:major capsid protein [Gammaproteobacteria bacterium]
MNLDQFFADPHFQLGSLTAAINEAQSAPTVLASLGLFQEEGITTTTFQVEYDGEVLSLVDSAERGQVVQDAKKANRKLATFSTVHLPATFSIKADEITNVRAFGTQSETQAIQQVVNQKLAHQRQRLVATRELMRAGAITGKVMGANGQILHNIYTAFGITEPDAVVFDPAAKKTKTMLSKAKSDAKKKLGQAMVQRWFLVCGANFFDKYSEAADVVTYLQNRNGNSNDNVADMTDGLDFHNVLAFRYDASVLNEAGAEVKFIGDNEAYLVPMVPGLFIGRNAPADYTDTVGTVGLPFYAYVEPMAMKKGVSGEAQSNPFYLCTRPLAIQKFTVTA